MYVSEAQLQESGSDWYIETTEGAQGPMDSQTEAANYINLLNAVNAARAGIASSEHDYPETEMIYD